MLHISAYNKGGLIGYGAVCGAVQIVECLWIFIGQKKARALPGFFNLSVIKQALA
jgi:hypothetical protein